MLSGNESDLRQYGASLNEDESSYEAKVDRSRSPGALVGE